MYIIWADIWLTSFLFLLSRNNTIQLISHIMSHLNFTHQTKF